MREYMQQLFAERIGGASFGLEEKIYKFEKIKQEKRLAIKNNPHLPLIDLGVGEPDWMADKLVVEKLSEESRKRENRFYADNGIDEFKIAASLYMKEVFKVDDLDWETEINHTIGAKSALSILPAAFINPGDITLMPVPNYPVIGTFTKYYGGEVVELPLLEENGFLPKFHELDEEIFKRAKLLYLNYPNNPTGAVATREFFEEVVTLAKKHQIIVIHDAAYAALTYDGQEPLSFLSIPGAKDVGVEIHSLSKAFNMTGWRIGFIAGHSKVIHAFKTIKDHCDSGQFIPIQKAASYAIQHPEITEKTVEKYSRRFELLSKGLRECGFQVEKPKGSIYLYTKAPIGLKDGPRFKNAEEFALYLIREHLISTVPWDDVGSYIRFSVTFEAEDERAEEQVVEMVKSRLKKVQFLFEER